MRSEPRGENFGNCKGQSHNSIVRVASASLGRSFNDAWNLMVVKAGNDGRNVHADGNIGLRELAHSSPPGTGRGSSWLQFCGEAGPERTDDEGTNCGAVAAGAV